MSKREKGIWRKIDDTKKQLRNRLLRSCFFSGSVLRFLKNRIKNTLTNRLPDLLPAPSLQSYGVLKGFTMSFYQTAASFRRVNIEKATPHPYGSSNHTKQHNESSPIGFYNPIGLLVYILQGSAAQSIL